MQHPRATRRPARVLVLALGALVCAGPALSDDALRKEALELFAPVPPIAPLPPDNPFTRQKAAAGARLFAEPGIAREGGGPCLQCHDPGHGGADRRATALGHSWQSKPRNTPTILNAALNSAIATDEPSGDRISPLARSLRAGLETDRIAPVAVARLAADGEVAKLLAQAFADAVPAVSPDTIVKALEAYLATLVTPGSAFDRFLGGDDRALSLEQKLGLTAFIDKGCAACHNGVNLGGLGYEAFDGSGNPPADAPRWRVSPLRNAEHTAPYFHDGSAATLADAVRRMSVGQVQGGDLDGDVRVLAAFIRSLSQPLPSR